MTISLHAKLSRETVAEGQPAELYLALQLTAPAAEGHRPALNLAAVVDRSGSMAGQKLTYTRQALRFLVDQTLPVDALGIITFDDQVATLVPGGPVINKDALKAQVQAITDGGSTNLSGGLLAGYQEVRRTCDPHKLNRVLLMTDGEANVGITDPRALVKKAGEMKEKGLQLSTLGVGAHFEEDLLAAMAEAGGGNFHYIANPDEIPGIFARELAGLIATVAQGLTVQFRPAPGVTVQGVLGYRPTADAEGNLSLALPDLMAAESKYLVLALTVEPAFAGERWLGRVQLLGTTVPDGDDLHLELDVAVNVADSTAPEDPGVMGQVHLARAAEAQEQAISAADAHDAAGAAQTLRAAAAPLAQSDDPELQARANELLSQAEALAFDPNDALLRKQLRAQSFRNRPGRR